MGNLCGSSDSQFRGGIQCITSYNFLLLCSPFIFSLKNIILSLLQLTRLPFELRWLHCTPAMPRLCRHVSRVYFSQQWRDCSCIIGSLPHNPVINVCCGRESGRFNHLVDRPCRSFICRSRSHPTLAVVLCV